MEIEKLEEQRMKLRKEIEPPHHKVDETSDEKHTSASLHKDSSTNNGRQELKMKSFTRQHMSPDNSLHPVVGAVNPAGPRKS